MKRTFLAAMTASLLLFALPAVASAHHRKHHASCARRHHAKCARAHVLSFGSSTSSAGSASSPATPTTETAGTVKSFLAPVLTITLNDKTEVSGKVTESTRIECESPAGTGAGGGEQEDDDGGSEGGDESRVGVQEHGDLALAPGTSGEQDDQGQGDDQGDDDGNVQPCTTSALTAGAVVRTAELLVGAEGAVWEKVLLMS